MSWLWAALTPHPPVIVPDVGRGREREASVTVRGIERLADLISEKRPDCLLVLSPHQPYVPDAMFINGAPHLKGSFLPFGSQISFEISTPANLRQLTEHLASKGVAASAGNSPDITRDQGTLVPLYFIREALNKRGLALPDTVLASPIGLGPEKSLALGEALASFENGESWGLLASGDLSHRLTPDAPAGYSPAGKKFDAIVVDALSSCDPRKLLLSPREREEAGECGLCSIMAMLGFCRALNRSVKVISYEGPFGVGYCNALAY